MSYDLETHDYQCPCDLCEPEAHSVQVLPDLETDPIRPGMHARTAATMPPSSRADVEALAFEELVKRVGEGRARWTRLLDLLEGL